MANDEKVLKLKTNKQLKLKIQNLTQREILKLKSESPRIKDDSSVSKNPQSKKHRYGITKNKKN